MHLFNTILYLTVIILSIIVYLTLKVNVELLCEVEKCPFCYGTNLCNNLTNFTLYKYSPFYFFTNLISVKNVFYGEFNNKRVVFKKLTHSEQLLDFDRKLLQDDSINYTSEILNEIMRNKNIRVCSQSTAEILLELFLSIKPANVSFDTFVKQLWTIVSINVEPLMLQILDNKMFPLPTYYGSCGRLIVESYSGLDLNNYENANWFIRAHIALQLLDLADVFTNQHPILRFYLTDISSDNIVVNDDLKINIIDLENLIVNRKTNEGGIHFSQDFEDNFAFNDKEICQSSISDHNYYAICKVLLSRNAPWPMMKGGLLHSIPENITRKHQLVNSIDLCVSPMGGLNRFQLINTIRHLLEEILHV